MFIKKPLNLLIGYEGNYGQDPCKASYQEDKKPGIIGIEFIFSIQSNTIMEVRASKQCRKYT